MEELQSTEVLAREILEDARKKAIQILKSADNTVQAQTAEWERKTEETINDLEKKHIEQCKTAALNIAERFPMDKRRAKVEKIENLLQTAVESWYKSLTRQKMLNLLTKELVKRLEACEKSFVSDKKHIYYCGLDLNEVKEVIKIVNGTKTIEEIPSDVCFGNNIWKLPSIILETETVKITVSIQEIADLLLNEKRAELVEALVGRAFIEGEL